MTEDSPAARLRAAAARRGSAAVARDACRALAGEPIPSDVLLTLGGAHAQKMLDHGEKP
ncbi:MAG: hypothetical protein HOV79_11520, partial [Hamadaea sp.]|nr:hypothetical protein [Hamadaea sp.]